MIKKLGKKNWPEALQYLIDEKEFNQFIISDIENYGFKSEFQDLWAEVYDRKIKALMLRFYDTFICYAKNNFAAKDFSIIIKSYKNFSTLMGKPDVIGQFKNEASLNISSVRTTCLAKLDKISYRLKSKNREEVKVASAGDLEKIIAFQNTIEEFSSYQKSEYNQIVKNNIATKTGRCYFIETENQVTATALSTAETAASAMIMGVATGLNFRNRGFDTKCLFKLCTDLLSGGKTLSLFYDNPMAGKIYKKLGFEDIGLWNICDISNS